MKTLDRRDFLKIAGAGTVALAAGAAVPVAGFFGWSGKDVLRFRAVVGMPKAPLPTYASYVIEGTVDIRARTGRVAKSLHAGAPDAMSGVVFPGTARAIQISDVQRDGKQVRIRGQIAEPVTLLKGEGPEFVMVVDQSSGIAHADFLGTTVVMRLDSHD
jgi:anaerobic selenocysteine-containing dehydrogenase